MPSPFPGMDPYLEDPAIWSDFHGTFLMTIRADLNKSLPEPYVARWDRYVWIDEPDAESPKIPGKPDVFVSDVLGQNGDAEGVAVLSAPATVTLPAVEAAGKPFLKIIDTRGRRVVTVVELLSPANKSPGPYRDAYLANRLEYFRTGTNVVELDLLRSGLRSPVAEPLPPAGYYLVVSRSADYPKAGVWPLGVRDPLPRIPIPLDPDVEAVWLSLRPCMDRAYDEGRFSDDIDYEHAPQPPLGGDAAQWARELLAKK